MCLLFTEQRCIFLFFAFLKMPLCAALNCNNKTNKFFFRFPSDMNLRKQWEISLKRKNFKANDSHRLCEDHFESACFQMNLENARAAGYKFVRLIPGSKPTKFNFTTSSRPSRKSLAVTKRRNLEVSLCFAMLTFFEKLCADI